MFIEMTTFAVPTFLVEGIKFALLVMGAWVVLTLIGLALYSFMTARAIEKQMRIDAEIDRLHM